MAGLLLGVACCPDGSCALCAQDRARQRRTGFSAERVTRDFARRRARLLDRCPACGFPPPPPIREIPPLPRLDRSDRELGDNWTCRLCSRRLPAGKRTFCSTDCYLEAERQRLR